jgi:hypothetical protein
MDKVKTSKVFFLEYTVDDEYAYLQVVSSSGKSFKTVKLNEGSNISIIINPNSKSSGYNSLGKEGKGNDK